MTTRRERPVVRAGRRKNNGKDALEEAFGKGSSDRGREAGILVSRIAHVGREMSA